MEDKRSEKPLNLINDLLSDSVLAQTLLLSIQTCRDNPSKYGFNARQLDNAHDLVVQSKDKLSRDANGKRYMQGEDEMREKICRMLFGIPLQNLRRKEGRVLAVDPVQSAAPEMSTKLAPTVGTAKSIAPVESTPKQIDFRMQNFTQEDMSAFNGYIGNQEAVSIVENLVQGSLIRGDSLRPILMRGVSGCGKTEFAIRLAKRLGRPFYSISASLLQTGEDLNAFLNNIPNGGVVFIDEIHACGSKAIARLLTVNNDIAFDGTKDYTFIFATNLSGKLPDALKNRCTEIKLRDYSISELMSISKLTAKNDGVELTDAVAQYIALRSHGIARYAVDYTHDLILENARHNNGITVPSVQEFFALRGIDNLGLKDEHRKYIRQLGEIGQASAHSLASALGENDTSEIERSVEPLLLRHGLIAISSKGRYLTTKGEEYAKAIKEA